MSPVNAYMNGHSDENAQKDYFSRDYAAACDRQDPLRHIRGEFLIPTKADLKRQSESPEEQCQLESSELCTYLCGNSLGVQPARTEKYVNAQLSRWRTQGVYGHFKSMKDSVIPPWIDLDDVSSVQSGLLVGADSSEVVVMQTLTGNLHLLMASFYRPTNERHKIIIEEKAFPSDHYAVQSQIWHHNRTAENSMVLIQPSDDEHPLMGTSHILSTIEKHASSTALLLLPGIQFYTGELLDIPTITKFAQDRGIVVGWDLAHAIGNVPLQLHDWNVDFAAWCNYKYMNCGPGATGGLFVHERHTRQTTNGPEKLNFRHRLAGWWGNDKGNRFQMTNEFAPMEGAKGFQLSNPSALDLAAVLASLSVFSETSMAALREKSLKLTAYLELLLARDTPLGYRPWKIITPADPAQRGAQLSVKLEAGLLDDVMKELEDKGVVLDERKPDVVRVAPAPLYNSYEDVRHFAEVFHNACDIAVLKKMKG